MQDKKSAITGASWYDRIQNIRHHNSQAISRKNSCMKINADKEVGRKLDSNNENIFTGSLAEVYEKALTNVLNIQPHVKMDETQSDVKDLTVLRDKKLAGGSDIRHFAPPEYSISGTYKPCHSADKYLSQHQNMFEVKKLNATNKSAFHVPEKRRALSNGLSRPTNWSIDPALGYPVNYPSDYYQVIHPSGYYARGSPYHGAFIDRMNFYPGPRGGECPPFTHVLPWTPFEREFKSWGAPRYCEWRPKRTLGTVGEPTNEEKKAVISEKAFEKGAGNEKQHAVAPRPSSRELKTAEPEGVKSSNCASEPAGGVTTKLEKCVDKVSHLDYNVKTRRMRAFQKRKEFSKENNKDSFDNPKEEFLFRLGLTRVH